MNIYQAQRYAEENDKFQGGKFIAIFPAGPKVCTWLDAYFGMFTIEGIEDGFVMVKQIDDAYPNLLCQPI
jgi:hypothetical protein